MTRRKLRADELRIKLHEFADLMTEERDSYAKSYEENGFGRDREIANELNFLISMLGAKTRDEFGSIENPPGFPIPPREGAQAGDNG